MRSLRLLTRILFVPFLLAGLAPALRAQCGPAFEQELIPPDSQPSTSLGRSVALSGDVVVSGSGLIDNNVNGIGFRGAVYVWRRVGGAFALEQKLPGPPAPQTYFGDAVAVDGDALVASQFASSYPAEAVRVFRRLGGTWSEEAHLMPADPLMTNGTQLRAVAIEGDWVAAGHRTALGLPTATGYTGAVYLYRRTGGVWSQHSKLVPADALNGDQTGWSLDLRGGVLAFASRATSTGTPGRVHVYALESGAPVLEATLSASTPGEGSKFGYAVATDGARLAVSDIADGAVPGNVGAVYVYRREAGSWVEEQVLRTFLPAGAAAFGRELALDGDDLYASDNSHWPAVVHHFRRVGGVWIELGPAAATQVPTWGTGALDAESGTLVAGSPTVHSSSGGVYVFDGGSSQQVCTYCTAKVNSQGCAPTIGWSGLPSASAGSGFVITASQIVPGMNGLLFYGLSDVQAAAFQGGLLCMKSPVTRTVGQSSGGAAPCSGTFALDFNAWIASGVDPLLATGAVVRAQYWSRDPAASFGSNLTDALSFVIAP